MVDDEDGPLDVAALVDGVGPDTELYVCGPSGMLAAVQHAWITSGRPPARLRFETFGNSGNLPTTPFIVRVPRLGLDVEVPPESTAVQALEAAGAEVMSDCLRASAGCASSRFSPWDQEPSTTGMCSSARGRSPLAATSASVCRGSPTARSPSKSPDAPAPTPTAVTG